MRDTKNTEEEVMVDTPEKIPPQGGKGGLKQRKCITKKI